jgi:hypothetical protein
MRLVDEEEEGRGGKEVGFIRLSASLTPCRLGSCILFSRAWMSSQDFWYSLSLIILVIGSERRATCEHSLGFWDSAEGKTSCGT